MASKVAHTATTSAGSSAFNRYLTAAEKAAYAGKQNLMSVRDLQAWLKRFGQEIVEETIIPRRTLLRRKARKEKLSQEETDRALRMARITLHAERTFHDPERGQEWLMRPNKKFGGRPPVELLRTEAGSVVVQETLYQIQHGIFA
jgi:putative toxin-antitoxin system antitoxin component (TIGR02293 family)